MAKKLKALAKHDDNLAATIRESANQIWLAGLGAFAKAQAEGQKVFDALVAEGQRVQEETKTAADERIAEIKSRGAGAWDKLEKVFEDRVQRALVKLGVPGRDDLNALTQRVERLTEELRKANGGSAPKAAKAPRKAAAPAAAKAAKAPRKAAKATKAPARKPAKAVAEAPAG